MSHSELVMEQKRKCFGICVFGAVIRVTECCRMEKN